ncbi:MAG: hypothetical protein QOI34_1544 [Verrucomicrobiota bacterium]
MNTLSVVRVLVAGLVGLLVQGCASSPKTGASAVAGAWTNSVRTVWTLNADGTFDADVDHNGSRDAWGKYTVEGNVLTMWRVGGLNPKHCDGKGVYRFVRTADTLQFTLVSDSCKLRKQNMLIYWLLK